MHFCGSKELGSGETRSTTQLSTLPRTLVAHGGWLPSPFPTGLATGSFLPWLFAGGGGSVVVASGGSRGVLRGRSCWRLRCYPLPRRFFVGDHGGRGDGSPRRLVRLRAIAPLVFCLIIGACVLLSADFICQLLSSQFLLPINTVTTLIGSPVVIYLLFKSKFSIG